MRKTILAALLLTLLPLARVDAAEVIPGTSAMGPGDVMGPGSSTDNAIPCFDGVTGKIIKACTAAVMTSDLDMNGNDLTGDFVLISSVADGASAVSREIRSTIDLSTAGAEILEINNNVGDQVFAIRQTGSGFALVGDGATIGFDTNANNTKNFIFTATNIQFTANAMGFVDAGGQQVASLIDNGNFFNITQKLKFSGSTLVIADSGDASVPAGVIISASITRIVCQDSDGCTATFNDATTCTANHVTKVMNDSTNTVTISDGGATGPDLNGAFAMGENDVLNMLCNLGVIVESSRSDN